MIDRYSLPEMAAVWADTTRLRRWLEIELLATEAHAELGVVPVADGRGVPGPGPACRRRVRRRGRSSVSAPPTTTSPPSSTSSRRAIGTPAGSWIHYGLTSSDVVDTALCWAMRDAVDLLLAAATELAHHARRRWRAPTSTR